VIIGYVVFLVLAILIFVGLRRHRRPYRFLIPISVFLLGVLLMAYLLSFDDEPPEGSVPVDQEMLKREGVTAEEWREYEQQRRLEAGTHSDKE
jgi:hypothetical protein